MDVDGLDDFQFTIERKSIRKMRSLELRFVESPDS